MERLPDTVLERAMVPAGDAVMRLSSATRKLQHQGLQFNIVYLLCGLTVEAILAWIGAGQ